MHANTVEDLKKISQGDVIINDALVFKDQGGEISRERVSDDSLDSLINNISENIVNNKSKNQFIDNSNADFQQVSTNIQDSSELTESRQNWLNQGATLEGSSQANFITQKTENTETFEPVKDIVSDSKGLFDKGKLLSNLQESNPEMTNMAIYNERGEALIDYVKEGESSTYHGGSSTKLATGVAMGWMFEKDNISDTIEQVKTVVADKFGKSHPAYVTLDKVSNTDDYKTKLDVLSTVKLPVIYDTTRYKYHDTALRQMTLLEMLDDSIAKSGNLSANNLLDYLNVNTVNDTLAKLGYERVMATHLLPTRNANIATDANGSAVYRQISADSMARMLVDLEKSESSPVKDLILSSLTKAIKEENNYSEFSGQNTEVFNTDPNSMVVIEGVKVAATNSGRGLTMILKSRKTGEKYYSAVRVNPNGSPKEDFAASAKAAIEGIEQLENLLPRNIAFKD